MNQFYNIEKLTKFRRELHQKPELSGFEKQTSAFIKAFLAPLKPDQIIENLGGHGLAFVFKGKEAGKRLLLRTDMDALPITEKSTVKYKSKNEGVAHLCGHDGHSTIMAGVAMRLAEKRPQKGEVVLLFQPAEETGEGAEKVINDQKFASIKPDIAFALHNLPGFALNTIVVKKRHLCSGICGHQNKTQWPHSPCFAARNRSESRIRLGRNHRPLHTTGRKMAAKQTLSATNYHARLAWR